MMRMTVRVLGARRLSRVTDNSTSFERQALAIEPCAEAIGGKVVHWADDPDVSASKLGPFDRPGIGSWLRRPDEYDAIIWWRQDRAIRDMGDMFDLGRWAKQHKKRLIFAEGPFGDRFELDFTSPMSELIVLLLAFAAQMEGVAIKERVAGARAYLRSVGRWGGGPTPFGRVPVPHPTEKDPKTGKPAGFWLARHEPTAVIVDEMIERVLDKQSYHAVAEWINTEHPAMTPANHRRILRGEKPDPNARWTAAMVSTFLRSKTLRGWQVVKGEVVRGDKGEPILVGDPLVSDEVWYRLQAEMDSRLQAPTENRNDVHPLLGVAMCGSCGGRLYQGWFQRGKRRPKPIRQYKCAAKSHARDCEKPAYVVADPVDAYVEEEFLARVGDWEVVEVVEHPAIDYRDEIAELEETVRELGARLAEARGAAADAIMSQLQGRSDRLDELRQKPVQPARTERRPTGKTYAEVWRELDTTGRLRMLREAGARVVVGKTYRGARDVRGRLSFEIGVFDDPETVVVEDLRITEAA